MRGAGLALGLMIAAAPAFAEDCATVLDTQIQRIFDRQCVACHQTVSAGGDLNLQRGHSYAALVGAESTGAPLLRVTPGLPEDSYLLHKLDGTQLDVGGTGQQMPVGGRLRPADRQVMADWITSCGT